MSKVIGDIAEAYVIYRLFTYGLQPQLMFSDNTSYDALIEVDGKVLRIQVKGSNNIDGSRKAETVKFTVSKGGKCKDKYNAEDFDILAVVYNKAERCIFYPNIGGFKTSKRVAVERFTEDEERTSWESTIKAINA